MRRRKILYVVNHAAFFVSHRLPLALAARESGYDVELITGQPGSVSMEEPAVVALEAARIKHSRVAFGSASINPFIELYGLVQLIRRIALSRPDLVHCASPKGLLYGGIAARLCRVSALVLAVSGMGYAFTDASRRTLLRTAIGKLYRQFVGYAMNHRNCTIIVQNLDDRSSLLSSGRARKESVELIPGSGVRLDDFLDAQIELKSSFVLLPARMLFDKGVLEFVEAVQLIKHLVPGWRFVLAGAADYRNPTAIPQESLVEWQTEGIVEWLGHVEQIAPYFRDASIVCLPSYREGMPKVLLEAAAAGCAIVTTDAVGCREAIVPGQTGELVPVRNSQSLADTLLALIRDRGRRERYGKAGRELAIAKYSIDAVVVKTNQIYEKLLLNV